MTNNETLIQVKALWDDFYKTPFPPVDEGSEKHFQLVVLDTWIAGCISTFLDRKGSLDAWRLKVLQENAAELRTSLPDLRDNTRFYFEQLQTMADIIVQYLKPQQR
jgi:hypothetical protein